MIDEIKTSFSDPRELIAEWVEWLEDWNQAYPDDDLVSEARDEVVSPHRETDKLTRILGALYQWWATSDEVPNKVGNALHVRTALYLYREGKLDPRTLQVSN